ncbi:hypothetical protein O3P69_018117 [Scylla paramamosain]|uniref:HTH CENPB-type domain-containing protein n=1 Tax=Scylla paramamosain TaxID=85552 RepID=A0AAW0TKX0_SCYPA
MASTQHYMQEQVKRAVELVRSKQMFLKGASKAFGIPYGTLGDKVRGRRPMQAASKTVLLKEEEKKLVDWLIEVSQRGFGWTKDNFKDMMKTILDTRGAKTVFKENCPGKDWMQAFFNRHPEIWERMGQPLGHERAVMTKDALGEWFQHMKHYLDTIDPTLLTSPDRIFNTDEKKRPLVLFVDGHSSLWQSAIPAVAISTLCNENSIILYCLKAHASHLIQPLDLAFFGAVKLAWSEAIRKFQYRTTESVTMRTFAQTLKKAWDTTARPELAFKGFVKSGICPFNPEVVLNSDKLKLSCSFSIYPTVPAFHIKSCPTVPVFHIPVCPTVPAFHIPACPTVPAFHIPAFPTVPAFHIPAHPTVPAFHMPKFQNN